jgi:hypothetical protein
LLVTVLRMTNLSLVKLIFNPIHYRRFFFINPMGE